MNPKSAATALLRWGLGVMFLFIGLSKFYGQGGFAWKNLSGFVQGYLLQDKFREMMLPAWLVAGYGYTLPFAEMLLGLLLLLGLARNPVLLAAGGLMLTLVFGAIQMKDWSSSSLRTSQFRFALARTRSSNFE